MVPQLSVSCFLVACFWLERGYNYDIRADCAQDNRFLTDGRARQICRSGQTDPNLFVIFEMHGLWFVRGDLSRDLAALIDNLIEMKSRQDCPAASRLAARPPFRARHYKRG